MSMGRDSYDNQPREPERQSTDRFNNRNSDAPRGLAGRLGRIPAAQRLPRPSFANRNDMTRWFQDGGWRYVAGVAALIVLLLFYLMWSARSNNTDTATTNDTGVGGLTTRTATLGVNTDIENTTQADLTPVPSTNQAPAGALMVVTGTAVEGLFLRPEPNTNLPPLETLPEGSIVTVIGEDSPQSDRVWKHIKSPTGQEGWAAAEFLQPTQ